jgi:hypothetical protein
MCYLKCCGTEHYQLKPGIPQTTTNWNRATHRAPPTGTVRPTEHHQLEPGYPDSNYSMQTKEIYHLETATEWRKRPSFSLFEGTIRSLHNTQCAVRMKRNKRNKGEPKFNIRNGRIFFHRLPLPVLLASSLLRPANQIRVDAHPPPPQSKRRSVWLTPRAPDGRRGLWWTRAQVSWLARSLGNWNGEVGPTHT